MSDKALHSVTVAVMVRVRSFTADRLPLQGNLRLAGVNCGVSTNSEAVLGALSHWSPAEPSPEDFALQIMVDFALRPESSPPVFRGSDQFVFASFGSDMFGFDLQRKRISGLVSQQTAAREKFWSTVLLPISLGVMGCTFGVVPMHCACLEWKGQGLLIAGLSGAGKSTLSAAMSQYGFAFISDDWTYISEVDGSLAAYGLNVPLKLLPDAKKFFALPTCQLERAMNGEWAFHLDPSDFAAKAKPVASPRRLLLLQRSERGAAQFRRIDSLEVREFFERSSERLPASLDSARRCRSRIIERVAALDAYQFTYSGSPHEAANTIRYFLEK